MGYYLHITRKTDWSSDEENANISFEEWLNYMKGDPEMKTPTDWDAPEGYCEWIVYPGEFKPTFDYSRGTISVKNPDDEIIKKMIDVAEALNAKVQGDEGEIYDVNDYEKVTYTYPEDTSTNVTAPKTETTDHYNPLQSVKEIKKKPWWKFW